MKYGVIQLFTRYLIVKYRDVLGESFYLFTGTEEECKKWIQQKKYTMKVLSLCGGSWYNSPAYARCAYRYFYTPDDRDDFFGFRIIKAL